MSNVEEIKRCIACRRMGEDVEMLVKLREDGVFICGECVVISAEIILNRQDRFPITSDKLRITIGGSNAS